MKGNRGKLTFTTFGIDRFRDFNKFGSDRLADADDSRLSPPGKYRTQNRSPIEEINKNTKTNVHIGSLAKI